MSRPVAPLLHDTHTHPGHQPRLRLFHALITVLLLTLVGGLAWQQLLRTAFYHERERRQSERRIQVPGLRGNIYDREGRLLAGNRPRFAVTLALDELQAEFHHEYLGIRQNYDDYGGKDFPTRDKLEQIARYTVVKRYLDQLNHALGRHESLDGDVLERHFNQSNLLPYPLLNDLAPAEYARLIEELPVDSPLQVTVASVRVYPFGSLAAHALGYVSAQDAAPPPRMATDNQGAPETTPEGGLNPFQRDSGDDLTTFRLKGTEGRLGLEKQFDDRLQGVAGNAIYRVSPAGYRLNPPLEKISPVVGHDLTISLDTDLQAAAETALGQGDQTGSAVALDVRTGEVLVLASTPGYNLQDFTPRLSAATFADINTREAWFDRAVNGLYPPGSTFKLVTTIAALRANAITPETPIVDCEGTVTIAGHVFTCDNGLGHHGQILLRDAIAESCDIYFYTAGGLTTAEVLAREARRFQLDRPTGLEVPNETRRAIIPDAAWKLAQRHEAWYPGDTANMAIGQGFVRVTPLRMACFAASLARDEVVTVPTLLHRADAPTQHTESIGLTPAQRSALLDGMEGCTTTGTAAKTFNDHAAGIPGLRIAGKTGTAQIPGKKDVAWFICFAPLDHPQIAMAVAVEGEKAGESYAGGIYAAKVAREILAKWQEKQKHAPSPTSPASPFQLPTVSTVD